jgi:hypothetical protein
MVFSFLEQALFHLSKASKAGIIQAAKRGRSQRWQVYHMPDWDATITEEFMTLDSDHQDTSSPRWRYLLLAAAIFALAALLLATLWQVPRVFPGLAGTPSTPTALASPAASPAATLTSLPTATPAITQPTLTDLSAAVDDQAWTITFHALAEVPPGRSITEVLLWYDTAAGRQVRHLAGTPQDSLALSYQLDAAAEGLTRTVTTTAELGYWWLVRDSAGESARAGGTALLSPALQAMVVPPAPEPPPVDFTWALSESQHFKFYYMPGTAAERDLPRLAVLAQTALDRITTVLSMNLDGQMSIYFVPRIFWQGGAAYADKVLLISYLDRNYTGVETWTYFTHEGTHALAQDLIQPKDNGGGPDGVLVEGLAVWATGGHYRLEPLDEWAAVIAASDRYIPLSELRAGPFYDFQHEISYLEGGSFVKFLIERYGLDRFKELYGQATGDVAHDEALVHSLYDSDYAGLEQEWLDYLAGLNPTPEQARTLWLTVRSFDLMRRYETELDPDARVLPPKPPTEWLSDTLKIFLGRAGAPLNVVLETALIAAQQQINGDPAAGTGPDPEAASALLDDIQAALDAHGELNQPSLLSRQAILDMLMAQDRAVLLADADAFRATLDPAYAQVLGSQVEQALQAPFTTYRQEIVQLDLSTDGLRARGIVLLHASIAGGTFADDAHLFSVGFARTTGGWLMTSRSSIQPRLSSILLGWYRAES